MDLALFHDMPAGGGAFRVLAEYAARATRHRLTLYTRRPDLGLEALATHVAVRRHPLPEPEGELARLRRLWSTPRLARELAGAIDAGGHDAVFCHMSDQVQAPEVLPYLRTPSLYYAPEPLRAAYEAKPAFGREQGLKARAAARGLNPYERKRRALDRAGIAGAARVVTHSRFTAASLAEIYGVHAEVVPLGVDSAAFTPGQVPREGFVLAVGALHPLKGHQFVLEAVATLAAPRPKVVVVGDRGGLEGALRDHARALGVELELRQAVPLEELIDLYRRAGVVACGQIREPFGLTPLEAMATATPVVAVAEGGYLETIRDGHTGRLAPRDPEAFGKVLVEVLDDPEAAAALGRAGRAEVEAAWTWERTAAGFDRLLSELAAR